MAQPTFQGATVRNRGGFVGSISDSTAIETGTFDVGPGPNTGIIARIIATSGSGGDDITSLVVGGVTLTALAQEVIPSGNAKERFFYGVGLSLTGAQSFTGTLASANSQIQLTMVAFSDATAATFDVRFDSVTANLSRAVPTNANSQAMVITIITNTGGGTNAPVAPTVERLDNATNSVYYTAYVATRPGAGSSVNIQIDSTGNSFTPGFSGRGVSIEGSSTPTTATLSGALDTITGNLVAGAAAIVADLNGALDTIAGNLTVGGSTGRLTSALPLRDATRVVLPNRSDLAVLVMAKPGLAPVNLLTAQSVVSGIWTSAGPYAVGSRYNVVYEVAGEPIGCEIITATAP